jgi:hypothetical protein
MQHKSVFYGVLVLGLTTAQAQNQQPFTLGTSVGYVVSISSLSQSVRIGNAVMLRYNSFNVAQKFGTSARLLVACDGSWLSSTFQEVFQYGALLTPAEQENDAVTREEALDAIAIEMNTVGSSRLLFADQIVRSAPQHCKLAGREPRNAFIPVSRSADENGIFHTTSIITGTSTRTGGTIDLWMRTTEYKRQPALNPDGTPVTLEGITQKTTKATGRFSLQRIAFDCNQRRAGTYQLSTYEPGRSTPETRTIDRDKLRLSAMTPGTVGENELDWVCSLYGLTKR